MSREPRSRMPPLRMLATFEALARLGSRGAAAAELNVTLGAVGKQLRALEQWLGTPLFEPDPRDPTMTAAGRRLAQAVTAGMATIQLGIDEAVHPLSHSAELRLLVPASLSMNWLVPRLPGLEQSLPTLRLRLHATHTGEDWLSLPHDAAIRRDGFVPPGYRSEPLFREELTAFAAPSLLSQFQGAPVLEELSLLESRTRLGELDRWLAAAGVRQLGLPRRSLGHFYTAYEAALAGEGLVIVPTVIADEDSRAGRIRPVRPEVRIPGMTLALVLPGTQTQERSIQELAFWLRAEAARARIEPLQE